MNKVFFLALLFSLTAILACNRERNYHELNLEEIQAEIDQLDYRVAFLDSLKQIRITEAIARGEEIPSSILETEKQEEILSNKVAENIVVIKGQVDPERLRGRLRFHKQRSFEGDFLKTIYIEKDGSFSGEFELNQADFFELEFNQKRQKVFLQPGKTIGIMVDSNYNFTPQFIGDLSVENNFLNSHDSLFNRWPDKGKYIDFQILEKDLLAYAEYSKQHLDSLASSKNVDPIFLQNKKEEVHYHLLRQLLFAKSKQNDSLNPINDSIFQNVNLSHTELLSSNAYRQFLFEYLDYQTGTKEESLGNSSNPYLAKFDIIENTYPDNKIAALLKTNVAYEAIKNIRTIAVNDLYEKFQSDSTVENKYKQAIKNSYKQTIPLTAGAHVPYLKGVTLTGDEVNLSNYKGQYVYIFVWATWCGPCKTEMPAWEHMVSQMAHKNVAFLGISVDKSKTNWEEYFIYNKFPGVQLLSAGDWESPLIRDFKIQTVPQFILIDPNGKVVNMNAPAPTKGAMAYVNSYGV